MIVSVAECNHQLAIIDDELVRLVRERNRILELKRLLRIHTKIGEEEHAAHPAVAE